MKNLFPLLVLIFLCSCQNEEINIIESNDIVTEKAPSYNIDSLKKEGFKFFSYFDEATSDSVYMQQYFIAFLKSGDNRSQNKSALDSLQKLHLDHLGRMYELGFADISGPFGDNGEIRGITIYNTPTLEFADSLANLDPMVKAGRLKIEIHPWWAGKGFSLR